MSRKLAKTLAFEICASLLVAAALAGFNLLASEKPDYTRLDSDESSLQLMAHGRRGGGGHRRGYPSGRHHRPRPQEQNGGGHASSTQAQPAAPAQPVKDPQGQAPQTPPATNTEVPAIR